MFGSILGFVEPAVKFFLLSWMLEPCNFVALVMKFGQSPWWKTSPTSTLKRYTPASSTLNE
jgi:hypothetical protein